MKNNGNNLYQKILNMWGVILFLIAVGVFVLIQTIK